MRFLSASFVREREFGYSAAHVPAARAGVTAQFVILVLSACASEPRVANPAFTTTTSAVAGASTQRVAIIAKAGMFEPTEVRLVQGLPAVLEFTRAVDSTCMQAVQMPWMQEPVNLPMNERVEISVDTSMTGVCSYSCWMNMVFGKVVIDKAD